MYRANLPCVWPLSQRLPGAHQCENEQLVVCKYSACYRSALLAHGSPKLRTRLLSHRADLSTVLCHVQHSILYSQATVLTLKSVLFTATHADKQPHAGGATAWFCSSPPSVRRVRGSLMAVRWQTTAAPGLPDCVQRGASAPLRGPARILPSWACLSCALHNANTSHNDIKQRGLPTAKCAPLRQDAGDCMLSSHLYRRCYSAAHGHSRRRPARAAGGLQRRLPFDSFPLNGKVHVLGERLHVH